MTAFEKAWNISKQKSGDQSPPEPASEAQTLHRVKQILLAHDGSNPAECVEALWDLLGQDSIMATGQVSEDEWDGGLKGTSTDDIMAGMSEEERARYQQFLEHEYEHDEEGNPI